MNLRRLPRLLNTITADELRIPQPFASNAAKRLNKSTTIILFALVKSKRLLVQISEQMKRLNVHIRSMQRAFEQRPEVFQPVSVNVALCVANGMVDHSPVVILFKIIIGHER